MDGITAVYPETSTIPASSGGWGDRIILRKDFVVDGMGPLVVTLPRMWGEKQLQFYTEIGDSSSPKPLWSAVVQGHRISPNGLSDTCIQLIRTWLDACTKLEGQLDIYYPDRLLTSKSWRGKHAQCLPVISEPELPTRVIDVETLRLHCKSPGERGRYVALSHCWGGRSYVQTTTANLHQHRRGPLPALPLTFLDAISVTKVLGVRYLWIDSLCIVQDSQNDWHAEVPAMADVYENAFLTISADAATDATSGFLAPPSRSFQPAVAVGYTYPDETGQLFHGTVQVCRRGTPGLMLPYHDTSEVPARSTAPDLSLARAGGITPTPLLPTLPTTFPQPTVHSNITLFSQAAEAAAKDRNDNDDSMIPRSRLSTRGWVFQERVLAQRTLHFSKSEVAWECRSLCTCECSAYSNRPRMSASLLKQCLANFGQNRGGMTVDKRWRKEIVQEYSCLDLTVQTDRLPALSGLAKRLSRLRPDDTYVFGLWKTSFPRDLLWYTRPFKVSKRLTPYCAPTWSWGSVTGSTAYSWDDEIDEISPTLGVLSINVEPASANLFGNAQEGANVVIRGVFLRALLRSTIKFG